ncbi:transcription factor JunB-like [Lethenteron reissneri]|uniref:transcription factor JunB-like n=1 Tax=Lethenteron reissneri TaxID=7753 RepID=UPI002AB636F3|nr:transcription factor JunB-like [Lethenteron reissneri]
MDPPAHDPSPPPPTTPLPPSPPFFPHGRSLLDEEAEGFALGFVRALEAMHTAGSGPCPGQGSAGHGAGHGQPCTAHSGGSNGLAAGPVAMGLPLAVIDFDSQERLKAERKRQRNRLAASRCRHRKLERISRLEERVQALRGENSALQAAAGSLRRQVAGLRRRVLSHLHGGCSITAPRGTGGGTGGGGPAQEAC